MSRTRITIVVVLWIAVGLALLQLARSGTEQSRWTLSITGMLTIYAAGILVLRQWMSRDFGNTLIGSTISALAAGTSVVGALVYFGFADRWSLAATLILSTAYGATVSFYLVTLGFVDVPEPESGWIRIRAIARWALVVAVVAGLVAGLFALTSTA